MEMSRLSTMFCVPYERLDIHCDGKVNFNTLQPNENGWYVADDISKYIPWITTYTESCYTWTNAGRDLWCQMTV